MERKAITERMKVASLRHWGLHICPECGNEILETDLIEWDHRQALIHGGDHDHTNREAQHMTPPAEEKAMERCRHKWSIWKIIGHTGDWFHPHLVKRFCKICGETQTDER